jgi:hypothetical protein
MASAPSWDAPTSARARTVRAEPLPPGDWREHLAWVSEGGFEPPRVMHPLGPQCSEAVPACLAPSHPCCSVPVRNRVHSPTSLPSGRQRADHAQPLGPQANCRTSSPTCSRTAS